MEQRKGQVSGESCSCEAIGILPAPVLLSSFVLLVTPPLEHSTHDVVTKNSHPSLETILFFSIALTLEERSGSRRIQITRDDSGLEMWIVN